MAGRTGFTKRQKEQARQQKRRDKADRKKQRKLEKQTEAFTDANELERLPHDQAVPFRDELQIKKASDDDPEQSS